jgi:hypothetical protein
VGGRTIVARRDRVQRLIEIYASAESATTYGHSFIPNDLARTAEANGSDALSLTKFRARRHTANTNSSSNNNGTKHNLKSIDQIIKCSLLVG